jgi:hypothetical protein
MGASQPQKSVTLRPQPGGGGGGLDHEVHKGHVMALAKKSIVQDGTTADTRKHITCQVRGIKSLFTYI